MRSLSWYKILTRERNKLLPLSIFYLQGRCMVFMQFPFKSPLYWLQPQAGWGVSLALFPFYTEGGTLRVPPSQKFLYRSVSKLSSGRTMGVCAVSNRVLYPVHAKGIMGTPMLMIFIFSSLLIYTSQGSDLATAWSHHYCFHCTLLVMILLERNTPIFSQPCDWGAIVADSLCA